MKMRELMTVLKSYDPESEVHLGTNLPGRTAETYDQIWVGDYGRGPQINGTLSIGGSSLYVGVAQVQLVRTVQPPVVDLGHYDDPVAAARVHDFYVVHRGRKEPLNFPRFDYSKWLPPRTSSGKYNDLIAEILREKLLRE